MYEIFEHTADVGLRIRANSLERLLVDGALGMFSLMVANLDQVKGLCERGYCIGRDETENELLLFDWLNELLYTFESERLLLSEFEPRLSATTLEAICRGEPMDVARHQMDHEIKAVTYHGLYVARTGDQWSAEVILDI